jgi:hypothetical protein
MYHSTGVQKLSESQKSKLRNGHPVRIKQGSGNSLNLTDAQIKKLAQAHKRGAAYTIQMHPEQAEKHGAGIFGDIKKFALSTVRKNRDLLNPIIGRARSYAKSGIQKLADKANSQVDKYTPEIEGEGIIGDALKGLISMTGLGAKKKRGRPRKTTTTKKGKGVLTSLIKAVAPAVIDAAAGAAKGKVSGMGAKRKPGRPRKVGRPKGPSKKGPGRPRKKRSGGALIAPGYSAGQ